MESKGSQITSKQIVYFSDKETMKNCPSDVIKILLPRGKYFDHNMNFINCFLNNAPVSYQQLIFHWGSCHKQYKGFKQDVLEVITTHIIPYGEREVNYLIPVPVLFEALGLPVGLLPTEWHDEADIREPAESTKELATVRMEKYNEIFGKYCEEHGITFHNIDKMERKKASYMKAMRI